MTYLTYEGTINYVHDDIIDAEFTVIHDPTWMERASQIAFYNHVQNIAAKKPKPIISVVC